MDQQDSAGSDGRRLRDTPSLRLPSVRGTFCASPLWDSAPLPRGRRTDGQAAQKPAWSVRKRSHGGRGPAAERPASVPYRTAPAPGPARVAPSPSRRLSLASPRARRSRARTVPRSPFRRDPPWCREVRLSGAVRPGSPGPVAARGAATACPFSARWVRRNPSRHSGRPRRGACRCRPPTAMKRTCRPSR